MKSKAVWALVALNATLFLALMGQWIRPNWAHGALDAVRPSDYLMISGEVVGGNSAIIYIVDTEARQLGARTLDNTNRMIDMVPPIQLDRVFGNRPAGGAAPRGANSR